MSNEPFLEVKNIWKIFPGSVVLKDVNMKCYPGEIIGLIGENGAGKSTLMKIIAGSYTLDKGEILIEGKKLINNSPIISQGYGVSMVYQDTRLIPDLMVMQNIWLGHEMTGKSNVVDAKTMYSESEKLLKKFDIDIDPKSYVRDLDIAKKQLVEIVKALSHTTKLLILDEPTSSLTVKESEKLFNILREIKGNGTSILFISHRISEIMSICDRFVVLKDGQVSGEVSRKEATEDILVKLMVGRELKRFFAEKIKSDGNRETELLEVKHLTSNMKFEDISFTVKSGEIVGIFGIQGNGQREIIRTIAGLGEAYSGGIYINGKKANIQKPVDAFHAGVSYLTNERKEEGIFTPLSIRDNIALSNMKIFSKLGVLSARKEEKHVNSVIEKFGIKCNNMFQAMGQLSGGNQQKVAFAGSTLKNPVVFIADDPTVGIDIRSKSDMYQYLRDIAVKGAAVVILSSDITEVIGISDRILVVSAGKITKEIKCDEKTNEEEIMSAAVTGVMLKNESKIPKQESKQRSGFFNNPTNWISFLVILVATLLLGTYASQRSNIFLTPLNLSDIAIELVPLALVALGQSLVALLGGIDLSVGPLISLVVAAASFTMMGKNYFWGILVCLAIGLATGLLNGGLVTKFKVPPLIATLAVSGVVGGLALIIRPKAGGSISFAFSTNITYRIASYIPVMTIVAVVLFVLAEFIMHKTKPGTYLYATGSNEEAAFLAGIKIKRVKMVAYGLCGLLTAVAGLMVGARVGSGIPEVGTQFTMSSITAVFIGGISVRGGRGLVIGSFLGVLMIGELQDILNLLNVSAYYQYVILGLLLILAVSMSAKLPSIMALRKANKRVKQWGN